MQSQDIDPHFFISPSANLLKGSPDYPLAAKLPPDKLIERWRTSTGQNILERWRSSGFDREALEKLVGKFYDRLDLRGINLAGEDLTGADLGMVDMFRADLSNAILKSTNLENSYLSEADVKNTNFNGSRMDGVFLDNVRFDRRTSFAGVNLNGINFTLATDLYSQAKAQQRIISLKRNHPVQAAILNITSEYGHSFTRFFFCCAAVILIFAVIYQVIPGSLSSTTFGDSLYFSATAFTSFGSDIQPVSATGKLLATAETVIGYLMTGLLVTILIKRTIGD